MREIGLIMNDFSSYSMIVSVSQSLNSWRHHSFHGWEIRTLFVYWSRLEIPRSMVPASGTWRKRDLFRLIPAVSGKDYNGTGRKYTRKMEAVFPPEFTRTGTVDVRPILATGKKRNATVSARIYTESSWYPLGNDRKQQRNSPETATELTGCNLTPDFNRISNPIWLLISSEFRIGFHSGFRIGFHSVFHSGFRIGFLSGFQ